MGEPYRILHMNTHDAVGGAAKVARRLVDAHRQAGHNTRMLVTYKSSHLSDVAAFAREPDPSLINTCRQRGWLYYELQGSHRHSERVDVRACDVLHMHNLHGDYFNPFSLPFLSRSKPTVWTLHDMQALTGHCAHAFDCCGWQSGCEACPRLDTEPAISVDAAHQLWQDKKNIYQHTMAWLVTPSAWLGDMLANSILGHLPRIVIPNGIDTQIFKPLDSKRIRQKLGIPEDGFVVGAVSHGGPLANQWKGGPYTRQVLETVWQRHPGLVFVNIGGTATDADDPRIISVPHIQAEGELAEIYSVLDAFLYTPAADNFPLVILEALACGVPPVTFDTGGIPEMVDDGVAGTVVAQGDIMGLVTALSAMIADPEICRRQSNQARQQAEARFDHRKIAQQYLTLYQQAIHGHAAACRKVPIMPLEKVPEVIQTAAFDRMVSVLDGVVPTDRISQQEKIHTQNAICSDCNVSSDKATLMPDSFSAFIYSQRWHFQTFETAEALYGGKSVDMDNCELKVYQDLLVYTFIRRNLPAGARLLEVGGGDSRVLKVLAAEYECWNVDKLEGVGSGPTRVNDPPYRLIRAYMGDFVDELPESYFDLVFSISALEHSGEDAKKHLRICQDIERVMAPEGYSLHLFDIRLMENGTWTNGLLPLMYERYDTVGQYQPLPELDKDPQLYHMSEKAYERGWRQITGQSFTAFGKPVSYQVLWQKPATVKALDSSVASVQRYPLNRRSQSEYANLPTITLVTPSYNHGAYLEACIQSVLRQDYPKLRYLVMDGGSSDASVDIIRRYGHRLTHWQSQPDGGQYAAINHGFEMDDGEIMGWLNADDMLHPAALWVVARVFMAHPMASWITGRPTVWNGKGQVVHEIQPPPRWSRSDYLHGNYGPPHIQQESTYWRRRLWAKAGGRLDTDFKLAADMELWSRFFRHADLHTVDARIGGFRVHGAQKTATQMDAYDAEARKIVQRERRLSSNSEPDRKMPRPEVINVKNIPAFIEKHQKPGAHHVDALNGDRKTQPKVSVIVSSYNTSAAFMRECLTDLVNQSIFARIEVIIIDAASPANEAAVVREFQKQYGGIRYERTSERIPVYAAWNRAIRMAKGQYVMPFSTNDRIRKEACERLAAELDRRPDMALVYGDTYLTRTPHETFDAHTCTGRLQWPDYNYGDILQNNRIGPHPMWRRSIHDEIGYFDEQFTAVGDQEFWMRIGWRYPMHHIKEYTGLYLWHEDALSLKGQVPYEENHRIRDFYQHRYVERAQRRLKGAAKGIEDRVSIIILTRNNLEYTQKCLSAIYAHTPSDFEVIVVDNGSSDGTCAYLASAADKYKSLKVLNNESNLGFAKGNNQGFRKAQGELLLVMNNDVVVTPGWLERLKSCARRSPRIGMVGPLTNAIAGPQKLADIDYDANSLDGLESFAEKWAATHDGKSHLIQRPVGFCLLLKRALIERIGGFDPRFGMGNFEDDDFCLRAAIAGFEGRMALDCFVHHFGSRTFASEPIDHQALLASNWEIFKQKWDLPADLPYGRYSIDAIVGKGFDPDKHHVPLNERQMDAAKSRDISEKAAPAPNDTDARIQTLQQRLAQKPYFARLHHELGRQYRLCGQKEKSLAHFKRAQLLSPGGPMFMKDNESMKS